MQGIYDPTDLTEPQSGEHAHGNENEPEHEYEPEHVYTGDDGYIDAITGDVEEFEGWAPYDDDGYIEGIIAGIDDVADPGAGSPDTGQGDPAHAPHAAYSADSPSPVPIGEREHDPLLFAHLADLHLAPKSGTITKRDPATGRLVRDLDMTCALSRAVDDILAQDPLPSACVIAGDIFDTFQGSQDAIIDAARELKRLRDAGIEIVAIAGNHDTPTQKHKTPAYSVLRHEFCDIAEDDGAHFAYDEIEHVVAGDIEYVLLPHNAACAGGFEEEDFRPRLGAAKSVLVVHGVAAGDPSLAQMDEMKEIPIAKWLLDMDWDYVAFGHYHKPGWIPGYKGKAAYCGSLENTVISGPDVCHRRGPVYVDLSKDGTDKLVAHPQRIRRIVSLPDIDVAGRDVNAEELDREISELILDAEADGCIVLHKVKNVPRTVIKSMTRRAFQSVNPEMLFIKTVIEPLREVPGAMKLNKQEQEGVDDATDAEQAGDDAGAETQEMDLAAYAERNFKPLSVELTDALGSLIEQGVIQEGRREAVQSILDEVFENKI